VPATAAASWSRHRPPSRASWAAHALSRSAWSYIVEALNAPSPEVEVEVIKDFFTGYHSRNSGGDRIITDGDLPIIDVRHVDVPEVAKVSTSTVGTSDRHRSSSEWVWRSSADSSFCFSHCSSC
jgi:LssY C-terminus